MKESPLNKIENNESSNNYTAALDNIRLNRMRNFSPEFNQPDFETTIKELDEENKKQESDAANSAINTTGFKKNEPAKNTEKVSEDDDMRDKISRIVNISHILKPKESLRTEDNTAIKMDDFKKDDIDFVKVCLENPAVVMTNINTQNLQVNLAIQNPQGTYSYKSYDVSKGLINLIEYSLKSQKPVRLDFKGDSSVILKVNKEGKLNAEFISNDEAMAYALKSSIPMLKNKMDTEGILYDDVYYNDNKQNKKNKDNKGGHQ